MRRRFFQIFWAYIKAYKKYFNLNFWGNVVWPLGVLEIEFEFFRILSFVIKTRIVRENNLFIATSWR